MEGEEKMYKKLNKDENFSKPYSTWIIAYCLDTNSFLQQIRDISFGNMRMSFHVRAMQ